MDEVAEYSLMDWQPATPTDVNTSLPNHIPGGWPESPIQETQIAVNLSRARAPPILLPTAKRICTGISNIVAGTYRTVFTFATQSSFYIVRRVRAQQRTQTLLNLQHKHQYSRRKSKAPPSPPTSPWERATAAHPFITPETQDSRPHHQNIEMPALSASAHAPTNTQHTQFIKRDIAPPIMPKTPFTARRRVRFRAVRPRVSVTPTDSDVNSSLQNEKTEQTISAATQMPDSGTSTSATKTALFENIPHFTPPQPNFDVVDKSMVTIGTEDPFMDQTRGPNGKTAEAFSHDSPSFQLMRELNADPSSDTESQSSDTYSITWRSLESVELVAVLKHGELSNSHSMDGITAIQDTPSQVVANGDLSRAQTLSSGLPSSESKERGDGAVGKIDQTSKMVPATPDKQLTRLKLQDTGTEKRPTPKANPHSSERVHRITRAEQKKKEQQKESLQYQIQPLSAAWNAKIQQALEKGHKDYSPYDLGRVVSLAGRGGTDSWLNDEVVNGYLTLIASHGKSNDRPGQTPSHHAFTSFFFSNLESGGYGKVSRWAKRAKIGGASLLDVKHVFIPINSGFHWTLAVVSPKPKKITHYNSLGGNGMRYINVIKDWLANELGKAWREEDWTIEATGQTPKQTNSDDCGVFTITNARQLMLGFPPMSYTAKDIPLQRRRIVAELVNGGLLKSQED